jgi:CheY-like chemotaxis protein
MWSPAQPIVMLTAYAERFQAPNRPLSGIDFVVAKPPSIESLREAVTRFTVQ